MTEDSEDVSACPTLQQIEENVQNWDLEQLEEGVQLEQVPDPEQVPELEPEHRNSEQEHRDSEDNEVLGDSETRTNVP